MIKYNTEMEIPILPLEIYRYIQMYLPKPDIYNFQIAIPGLPHFNSAELKKIYSNYTIEELVTDGDLRGVRYLIESQGTINGEYNEFLLRLAASCGDLAIAKYLVESGAELCYREEACCSAYIYTQHEYPLGLAAKEGHLPVVKYLVESGVDIHMENDQALRWASKYGKLEIVRYLIAAGADISAIWDDTMYIANSNGDYEVVSVIEYI